MARLEERTPLKGGTTWFVVLPGLLVTDSLEDHEPGGAALRRRALLEARHSFLVYGA